MRLPQESPPRRGTIAWTSLTDLGLDEQPVQKGEAQRRLFRTANAGITLTKLGCHGRPNLGRAQAEKPRRFASSSLRVRGCTVLGCLAECHSRAVVGTGEARLPSRWRRDAGSDAGEHGAGWWRIELLEGAMRARSLPVPLCNSDDARGLEQCTFISNASPMAAMSHQIDVASPKTADLTVADETGSGCRRRRAGSDVTFGNRESFRNFDRPT